MDYKETLENAVLSNSFRLESCLNIEDNTSENIKQIFQALNNRLSNEEYKSFKKAIIRSAFFIELTNPTAETDSTKYQVHWVEVLRDTNDPRYASYDQCLDICENIALKISNLNDSQLQILKDYCEYSIYNFELPIDYIDKNHTPYHHKDNVDIYLNETIERCTKVRRIIKNPSMNPKAEIFKKILAKKIKVKSYQTDRAQTGLYQTNREKRWESHPNNYQYAYRRDCNDVEASLILQVCTFKGADKELVSVLQSNGLIPENFSEYTCPVTGDVLVYSEFEEEILHPEHGKSSFQVGHLEPLKSSGTHCAKNIGWISDDGNRIQGSLSMDQVNALLRRIYINRPDLHVDFHVNIDGKEVVIEETGLIDNDAKDN